MESRGFTVLDEPQFTTNDKNQITNQKGFLILYKKTKLMNRIFDDSFKLQKNGHDSKRLSAETRLDKNEEIAQPCRVTQCVFLGTMEGMFKNTHVSHMSQITNCPNLTIYYIRKMINSDMIKRINTNQKYRKIEKRLKEGFDVESLKSLRKVDKNGKLSTEDLIISYDSEWQTLPETEGNDKYRRQMLSWQFGLLRNTDDGYYYYDYIFYDFADFEDTDTRPTIYQLLSSILRHQKFKAYYKSKTRTGLICTGFTAGGEPITEIVGGDRWSESRVESFSKSKAMQSEFFQNLYPWRIVHDKSHRGGVKYEPMKNHLSELEDWLLEKNRGKTWDYFKPVVDPIHALRKKEKDFKPLHITLLAHNGDVDLSGCYRDPSTSVRIVDIMTKSSSIQGGLVSQEPIDVMDSLSYETSRNYMVFPCYLTIRDTMTHAPAGSKSLKTLGKTIGIPKLDVEGVYGAKVKDHMGEFLKAHPVDFSLYALQDTVVTLLYAASLYGVNGKIPLTMTSQGASVLRDVMKKYLGVSTTKDFDRKFRGMVTTSEGKFDEDLGRYKRDKHIDYISSHVEAIQSMCAKSYSGGWNGSIEIGLIRSHTFDVDSKNAYPTGMSSVEDIDWENPIHRELDGVDLSLDDFINPKTGSLDPALPLFGEVSFEFPSSAVQPTIPISTAHGLIYVLKTFEGQRVTCAGPELYLALKAYPGVKIHVYSGFILNTIERKEESPYFRDRISRSLGAGVLQLVVDRNRFPKGSLENKILKTIVNASYGKTAQDVSKKKHWDGLSNMMQDLGFSNLTSPYHASMITSLVRSLLLAAYIELSRKGYEFYSVTTDGFITSAPLEVLEKCGLFGFTDLFKKARLFLTKGKDPSIWAQKHGQTVLMNLTTRGNIGFNVDKDNNVVMTDKQGFPGVLAHNSYKSGYEKDSIEDLIDYAVKAGTRTGRVFYSSKRFMGHRTLTHEFKDFDVVPDEKYLSFDFDFKRKPITAGIKENSITINDINNKNRPTVLKLATIHTVPYVDILEFESYYKRRTKWIAGTRDDSKKIMENHTLTSKERSEALKKADKGRSLRTASDWQGFSSYALQKHAKRKSNPKAFQMKMLKSALQHYKAGRVELSELEGLTRQEIVDWVNSKHVVDKKFTLNMYIDCTRASNLGSALPLDELTEMVASLGGKVLKRKRKVVKKKKKYKREKLSRSIVFYSSRGQIDVPGKIAHGGRKARCKWIYKLTGDAINLSDYKNWSYRNASSETVYSLDDTEFRNKLDKLGLKVVMLK